MPSRKILSSLCAMGCAAVFALMFTSTPAAASGPICVERGQLVEGLSAKYQEHRQGVGITSTNTGALEFFASEKGTWTMVITTTNGRTCVLAAGHSWHSTPRVAMGPGA